MRLRSDRIVAPHGVLAGEVVLEGARISDVGPVMGSNALDVQASPGLGVPIELGECWLIPGFIDVHVHGGGGAQCNTSSADEIAEVARFHARHGTTGLLATTAAAPLEDLRASLTAIDRCTAPNLLGAHLEGPFLSPERPGAMDPSVFLAPEVGLLERLLAAGAGKVRLMTLAPELPGAFELIEGLVAAGVVASVGHTNASEAEVREAVRLGVTAATHTFNAMAPLHHRRPGALGAVLDCQEVSCELICDAVHVDPVAMRLLYRAKGADGIRLVTDAIAAAGMPDGEYRLAGRPVTVTGGRATLAGGGSIAGSTLTMEAAFQNAIRFLGVTVPEAVSMASTNSARLLGLGERKGAIAAGFDADLVVLNDRLAVDATMVAGQWVQAP